MVPFERALVSSYRPCIVTFRLSLRFFAPARHFFPTRTPLVSPKFPHVPTCAGGWPLGYEEEGVWLIVRTISFQDFQPVRS